MHRDLKLANLILSDTTDSARVVLADFGLSAVCTDEHVRATARCAALSNVLRDVPCCAALHLRYSFELCAELLSAEAP